MSLKTAVAVHNVLITNKLSLPQAVVLDSFGEGNPWTAFGDITATTKMSKPAVSRALKELTTLGFAERRQTGNIRTAEYRRKPAGTKLLARVEAVKV